MNLNINNDLSVEQKAFVDSARKFSKDNIAEKALEWDKNSFFPRDVFIKAANYGFAGIYVPEIDGGSGLTRLDASLIFEEIAYACPSTSAFLTIHNMTAWMLSKFGSNDLKKKYLNNITSMKNISSYCLTEPGSGSDANV